MWSMWSGWYWKLGVAYSMYVVQVLHVVVEHMDGGARTFGCRVHLEFACVAGCSLLVRHQGSHAWQSRAEVFMVDGPVLASRSA